MPRYDAKARIDNELLAALADRWPFIKPDFPGQTFEGWLTCRLMREYNEFGYPQQRGAQLDPPTLWHLVASTPPADYDDWVSQKADDLRAVGGTFVQAAHDLRALAAVAMQLGA